MCLISILRPPRAAAIARCARRLRLQSVIAGCHDAGAAVSRLGVLPRKPNLLTAARPRATTFIAT
jgi:hypothetical protein